MTQFKRAVVSVIAGLLVVSMLIGFVVMIVNAKSSTEIQNEIDQLQEKADQLAEDREALESDIADNRSKTLTIVEQKAQVDQDIELTRQEIENVNEQVHQYNLLIAEQQAELDELIVKQDELLERYKVRMRSIQERGEISRWAVILQAESFADMLNRRAMVEEIAKSDQRMIQEVKDAAAEVLTAKDALADEKLKLESKKAELAEAEKALEQKRSESDELLQELLSDKERLQEEAEKYEAQEAELSDQIAALERDRTEALRQEWIAAHPPQPKPTESSDNNNNNNDNNNDDTDETPDVPSSSESFLFPLPSGWGTVLTSPYGYRVHPITGNYSLHNGVDLAIGEGTPIYATKSGYVTTATYNYAYGYYVTINHMDGFSSLYGHMTSYTVTEGQYVSRGDVIGYVGTTGWSTGYHLHFTIYYNGSTVNPMNYISLQ